MVRVKNGMHRTNNHVDAWHRKLNCAFQAAHPTLWLFLDKLIKEENILYSDIINAMSCSQPPKQKNKLLNQKLQNLIEQPHTNAGDQLKYIGHLLSL